MKPDLYDATHQVLQANGYIIHKLCGAFCMDLSHGPISLCFDSAQGDWSDALLERMGLDRAKLPPIVPCSQVVGEVSRRCCGCDWLGRRDADCGGHDGWHGG